MKNRSSKIWQKVRKDLALNLSELAIAAGYDRGTLTRMDLPLQFGKMSLSDFKALMRFRQNKIESKQWVRLSIVMPFEPPASLRPGDEGSPRAVVDKFDAPSSRRGARSASRRPQKCPLHATG
jgi:hypothetical protein